MDKKLQLCQTCLCNDRYLYPLVKLKSLLKGFNIKLMMEGGVCWECKRYLQKYSQFRLQARRAQRALRTCQKIENLQPLSKLRTTKRLFYYTHEDPITHTNVTCHETGPIMIKQELDTGLENQCVDAGYVQIITKDQSGDNVVYDIEDNIDMEDDDWFDDGDDESDGEYWTVGKDDVYRNLCEEFKQQVQNQIDIVEQERRLNKKDGTTHNIDAENNVNKQTSITNTDVHKHIEPSTTKVAKINENSKNVARNKDVVKIRASSDDVIVKSKEIVRFEHNYCQEDINAAPNDNDGLDHNISELPRITMVESIQDQPSVSSKEPIEFTEIIELNISIPIPDSSGSGESTAGHMTTAATDDSSINYDNTVDTSIIDSFDNVVESSTSISRNDNYTSVNSKVNIDRTGKHTGSIANISSSSNVNTSINARNRNVFERTKNQDTNTSISKNIATNSNNTSSISRTNVTITNENKQNNVSTSDANSNTNVIFFGTKSVTSNSNKLIASKNTTQTSPIKATPSKNTSNNTEILPNITQIQKEGHNPKALIKNKTQKPVNEGSNSQNTNVQSHSDIRSVDTTNKESSKKIAAQRDDNTRRKQTNAGSKVADSSQKNKEKDTITVKVAYLAKPPADVVKIKSEPISDDEDVIVDDSSFNISQLAINKTSEVENMSQEEQLKHELWKKSILLVYNRLRGHKYASTFTHAVSDIVAPDYSKIVRKPMHLTAIRKNVVNGAIRTTAEFHRDLLLMLTNALMYNSSDHCVFEMAKDFLEEAKYQLDVLKTVHDESTLPVDASTPRPRSKRRQELEEKLAKRPKLSLTPIVPKIEKVDKKSRSKSKILPNPLSAARRVKNEKEVEKKKRGRKKAVVVKAEKIQAEVKKVSENCLLIGSKIVSVPNSSDTDDVLTSNNSRNGKLNAKHSSVARSKSSKDNVDVKPKINEIGVTPKRRGRKPKNAQKIKAESPDVVTSTVKSKGRKEKDAVSLKEHFESLAKMPNLSPIVKLEPISMSKENQDSFNQDLLDNPDTLDDFCVAITTEPQKDLTHDEASWVKKVLEEKILQLALDFSKFAPRFRGKPIIADGVVKLWCEDAPSLKWLKKTVSDLKKGFVVKKQAELPKKIKSAILIPGSNGEMAVTQKILAAQNPWAQVASWAFYSSEQRGESMILVIGIPSTLIPVILSKQRRLAYILGSVYVKFYNSEGKLTDLPPE